MPIEQQKVGLLALPAVLVTAITCGAGISVMMTAVPAVAEQFPDQQLTTVMQIVTLPNLLVVPVTLIAGGLAGKKIGFKPLILLGFILVVIGGLLPVFIPENWTVVMGGTVLRGIGFGLQMSMPATLAMYLWTGTTAQRYLGWANAALSLGGMLAQILGGALVAAGVNPWLGHLVLIPGFLIVLLGLPEPAKPAGATTQAETRKKIPVTAYWLALILLPAGMLAMVPMPVIASIVIEEELSDVTGAGLALSMFTLLGFLSGLMFSPLTRVMGRYWPGLGAVLTLVGLGIISAAGSLPWLMAGLAVAGFGYFGVFVGISSAMAKVCPPQAVGFGLSIVMAIGNVGVFLGPFFISAVQGVADRTDLRFTILVAAGLYLPLAIILLVWNPTKRARVSPIEDEELVTAPTISPPVTLS